MNNLQLPSVPFFVRHPSVNRRAVNRNVQSLRDVRIAMSSATLYVVAGDSTRDNNNTDIIGYYTRMLGKAGITVFDNAHSGQSGEDWANNTDVSNVNEAIAAIPGDGTGTMVEFSFGINDTSADGHETPTEQLAKVSPGLDALLAAKPNITLFFVQPVPVASAARNASMVAFYDLLADTYKRQLVKLHQPMADVYDNGTGNIFYLDGTHPNLNGSMRAVNYILSEILGGNMLSTVLLDNLHYTGSGENIIRSHSNVGVGQYWNSSGTRSNNASWASFDSIDVTSGQTLRITHDGSRDDVRLVDSQGALLSTLTIPDTGSAPGTYTYDILNSNVASAGCNITSTSESAGASPLVEVVEIVPGKGVGDLSQAEINTGLSLRLQLEPGSE